MRTKTAIRTKPDIGLPVLDRDFVEETIERVTGAKLICGNDVRLLIDAAENYPAWLEAIESAETRILFESYIIHNDEQGTIFADALIKKAKEGVEVKLIYDWLGGFGTTSRSYWKRLRQGGIDVRQYNPPKFMDPLGVLSRDHRKTLVVDGRVAFVSGLCVGRDWVGQPEHNVQAWRDTGVRVTGPAVSDVEAAFADVWATMGSPLDPDTHARRSNLRETGSIALRVVRSSPGRAYIYRADQLMSAAARETMWISDAYFVGIPSYLQSLKDAAADGVDVRILVPQGTDLALIRDTTRSTYRPLLEAGVRVFEWNGPMMHAKTAVFDGRFSRVGSTNLNISSWFGNYELDVLIEDQEFGQKMQEMFLNDLAGATEIVLADTGRIKSRRPRRKRNARKGAGSMRKVTAGALNAATSIGSAIANKMPLGPAESRLLFIAAAILLVPAVLLLLFPRVASIVLVVMLLIFAVPTLIRAVRNYRNN